MVVQGREAAGFSTTAALLPADGVNHLDDP